MSSSSTEPGTRRSLVRLAVALAFAVAALATPAVGSTSAHFTDSPRVAITFLVEPTATPTVQARTPRAPSSTPAGS